jgi:DNA methylase
MVDALKPFLNAKTVRSFFTKVNPNPGRERYRRASLSASTSFVAQALNIVISLVSVPLTLRYLGQERYGVWLTISSLLAWVARLVMGRGHYHWQHEPCWYAVRGTGHWNGDRTQSTLWQIENRNQDAKTVHSTQKPVECMHRPIVNNSNPGQAVYEPFSGSGTTIIACEKEARIALAIELEPAYVDVAVTRWQNFTGKQAVLDGDGRTFDEIALERAGALT